MSSAPPTPNVVVVGETAFRFHQVSPESVNNPTSFQIFAEQALADFATMVDERNPQVIEKRLKSEWYLADDTAGIEIEDEHIGCSKNSIRLASHQGGMWLSGMIMWQSRDSQCRMH